MPLTIISPTSLLLRRWPLTARSVGGAGAVFDRECLPCASSDIWAVTFRQDLWSWLPLPNSALSASASSLGLELLAIHGGRIASSVRKEMDIFMPYDLYALFNGYLYDERKPIASLTCCEFSLVGIQQILLTREWGNGQKGYMLSLQNLPHEVAT